MKFLLIAKGQAIDQTLLQELWEKTTTQKIIISWGVSYTENQSLYS